MSVLKRENGTEIEPAIIYPGGYVSMVDGRKMTQQEVRIEHPPGTFEELSEKDSHHPIFYRKVK